jgi:hypothetical protein
MPNRMLREGLVYSEAINRVSPLAEMLFWRMLVSADDFGLLEVGSAYLKSRCLPARDMTLEQIDGLVAELVKPTVGAFGLVRSYEAGGKKYAAIEKWDQRRFALKPKCPLPPWGTDHIRGGYVDPRARGAGESAVAPEKKKAPGRINGHQRTGAAGGWWATEDGILAKAKELEIPTRAGESWPELKGRINAEIDRRKRA